MRLTASLPDEERHQASGHGSRTFPTTPRRDGEGAREEPFPDSDSDYMYLLEYLLAEATAALAEMLYIEIVTGNFVEEMDSLPKTSRTRFEDSYVQTYHS